MHPRKNLSTGLLLFSLALFSGACGPEGASGSDPDASASDGGHMSEEGGTTGDGGANDGGVGDDGGANDGGATDEVRFFKSGTRLEIESIHVDGRAYFRGFYDKELGEFCSMRLIDDGETAACIPARTAYVGFGDENCTTLVGLSPQASHGGEAYALGIGPARVCGLESDLTLFPIGEARSDNSYYYLSGEDCIGTFAAGHDFVYELGEPLTVEGGGIATLRATIEPASSSVSRVRWVSEDGAEVVASDVYFDEETERRCVGFEVGQPGDTSLRCVPQKYAMHHGPASGPFADGQCIWPAAYASGSPECGEPEIALVRNALSPPGACGEGYYTLAEAGDRLSVRYSTGAGYCLFVPEVSGMTSWAVGDPVEPARFPELGSAFEGTGRVRAPIVSNEGVPLALGNPIDTDTGAVCTPESIGGEWFCTSSFDPRPSCASDFIDAECTIPVMLRTGCALPPRAIILGVQVGDGTCAPERTTSTVWPISSEPITLDRFYFEEGGSCVGPYEITTQRAYAIGEPVAAETVFSRLTFVRGD